MLERTTAARRRVPAGRANPFVGRRQDADTIVDQLHLFTWKRARKDGPIRGQSVAKMSQPRNEMLAHRFTA